MSGQVATSAPLSTGAAIIIASHLDADEIVHCLSRLSHSVLEHDVKNVMALERVYRRAISVLTAELDARQLTIEGS